jgi:hypothetical protein
MDIQNYLDNYNKEKKVSGFTKFLWWCAGADPLLLQQSPMQDRVKYAGIGGVVFCTGLLACVSGGYAFYTIFGPKGNAIDEQSVDYMFLAFSLIFGVVWGSIILNLDRFIVSSTGKGDGKDTISLKEFGQALPRIIIALILGIAISTPLEIRVLQSEIDANLQIKQDEFLAKLNIQTDSLINTDIDRMKLDMVKVEGEIKEIDDYVEKRRLEIKDQRTKLELEAEGKLGGAAGRGPAWRDKKENLDKQEQELNLWKENKSDEVLMLKTRYKKILDGVDIKDKSREEKKKKNEITSHQLDGLLARIEIGHEIGGWVNIFITLVLLSIEMGPIFFKMMMTKGVYDYLVENSKYRFLAYNGIIKSDKLYQDKDGTMHMEKYDFLEKDMELKEKQLKMEKQIKLSEQIVDEWHKSKSKEVSDSPSEFYTDEDKTEK